MPGTVGVSLLIVGVLLLLGAVALLLTRNPALERSKRQLEVENQKLWRVLGKVYVEAAQHEKSECGALAITSEIRLCFSEREIARKLGS
jgi:hypothetical protein